MRTKSVAVSFSNLVSSYRPIDSSRYIFFHFASASVSSDAANCFQQLHSSKECDIRQVTV